ncbi:MAG TPA: hypothetical protein VFV34_04040 [Blastocatellia bacterium]|nr:hypothetical protein [Blastocatellia bacterium]
MQIRDRIAVTFLIAFHSVACGGNKEPANTTANKNETVVTSRSEVGPTTETDPQKAAAQLQLLPNLRGIYTMSEIETGRAVTIVPVAFTTTFTFMEDGFYNRKSFRAGQEFSKGSGYYRIERESDGTLSLLLDQKFLSGNTAAPKREPKRQTIVLSPEGDILRLTGSDGRVGVFRRTGFSEPKVMK